MNKRQVIKQRKKIIPMSCGISCDHCAYERECKILNSTFDVDEIHTLVTSVMS